MFFEHPKKNKNARTYFPVRGYFRGETGQYLPLKKEKEPAVGFLSSDFRETAPLRPLQTCEQISPLTGRARRCVLAGEHQLPPCPLQGESKRITLVLQQPPAGGGTPGQRHVVLGSLPGKIVLQGNQLAALSQAKGTPGQPAKVVTIQLQVQQPGQQQQLSGQPGTQKIQLLQQPPVSSSGQQAPMAVSSVQQAQVVGGAGQRVTVPLKVVLQPQVRLLLSSLLQFSWFQDPSGCEGGCKWARCAASAESKFLVLLERI